MGGVLSSANLASAWGIVSIVVAVDPVLCKSYPGFQNYKVFKLLCLTCLEFIVFCFFVCFYFSIFFFFNYISLGGKKRGASAANSFQTSKNFKILVWKLIFSIYKYSSGSGSRKDLVQGSHIPLCRISCLCLASLRRKYHCEWEPFSQYGNSVKGGSFKISTQSVLLLASQQWINLVSFSQNGCVVSQN